MSARWLALLLIAVLLPLRGWSMVFAPAWPAAGPSASIPAAAPCHGTVQADRPVQPADAHVLEAATASAHAEGTVDAHADVGFAHACGDCDLCHTATVAPSRPAAPGAGPAASLPAHRPDGHADALAHTLERPPRA